MIIDGEAVILDAEGRSDFGLLQQSLGAAGNRASNAILYAFDLLYLDGHDLRGIEYRSRRHLLEDTLKDQNGAIRLSETIDADPVALLEHARSLGLEGIVGKHVDQPYRSGRTGDWVKLKCVQSESFFIAGYETSTASSGGIASLALAAYSGGEIIYVGNVGTGFKEAEALKLRKMLDKLLRRFTRSSTARAETASGGETMAPSAAQAAHGSDGIKRWTTIATITVVNSTAPMASDAIPKTCRFNRSTAIDHAPSSKSGGRKITRTSSGLTEIVGSPGTNANIAPPARSATDGGRPNRCAR